MKGLVSYQCCLCDFLQQMGTTLIKSDQLWIVYFILFIFFLSIIMFLIQMLRTEERELIYFIPEFNGQHQDKKKPSVFASSVLAGPEN